MKIIQITAAYKPAYIYGGPTMSVAKLCEALVEDEDEVEDEVEVEVEVFTTTANGKNELAVVPGETQIVDGVKVTYFKRLTKDHTHFSPALLLGLRKIIEQRLKIKDQRSETSTLIIHIHAWWNMVSILSCWLAKWYHVPVVLSPRGMLTDYSLSNRNVGFKSIIHWLIGKRLLRYCHIHATSAKEKKDILKFIEPKSITVIPNLVEGVGSSEYQVASSKYQGREPSLAQQLNNSPTQQAPFNLIFLSRIEKKKGLELLFEALAQFDVDWSLTIAGSGEQAYVESLKLKVESLKLHHHINWLGQVTNEDKFKLLAEHDLTLLTSYNENFANVVIESLSVGTPVLLSDEVGLVDYVVEKNLGWVARLDIESIKEKLNHAYLNVLTRQKIRIEAPQIINVDFNDVAFVKKYIDLYEQLV